MEARHPLKPLVVGLVMAALAVLSPFLIQITNTIVRIYTTTWMLQISSYHSSFRLLPLGDLLISLPFSLQRLVFAYQMARYYGGKTSRTNTIIVGVLSEMWLLLIIALLTMIAAASSMIFLDTTIPLPLLLLMGVILLWRRPMAQPTTPWD